MDNLYGINVKNKFELFLDEDVDPLDIIAEQENAKKTEEKKKGKDDKTKKAKNAKKSVLKTDNKNKPSEEIKPALEEKVNAPRQQSERPRTGQRQNRDNREDNRPPRRRDDNFNAENRDRGQDGGFRNDGGFRTERPEGGFGRGEGSRGRGRGGVRGRGSRGGGERGRGGFGKRDFDRHSGSDRTGVKPTEKREGGGSHNWGTVKDDIDLPPKVDYWRDPKEQMKDTMDEPAQETWNQQNEDTENKDPNESTESANPEETEEDQPKQMTLEEWKKEEEKRRMKSEFKVRKAGEGEDYSKWKTARVYRKSAGEEETDEEETDEDDEEDDRNKKLVNEIKITFNDSPRRGRGGRRPRGPRAGRGSGRGGDRRNPNSAPKFDDENDFPSLIKSAA